MLVLSRKINESIQIGTDVEIMVVDIRGDVVRLGITAPQSTQIWRKELWDVIVKENRLAADGSVVKVDRKARARQEVEQTPRLPVSAFSRLPKLPTVEPEKDN